MTLIIALIRESFDVRMFIGGDYEGHPSHIG